MKAEVNRSRPTFRQLMVEALAMCALVTFAAFAGSASRAQSAPAQQTPPTQPATQQPAPAQPAPTAQTAQTDPAKSQKIAGSDDDKWPDPEWATEQKQAAAPASTQPAPVPQSAPAPVQHDTTPAQPATQTPATAAPIPPRPLYTGTNPDELRKQQVALECSQLLQLATDLKAQVEKSRKDELSVSVVRKAVELEQMARKVRTGTPLSASNVQPPQQEAK